MEERAIAEKVKHLSDEELELYRMRHSLAHIMATAVLEIYPGTKLGYGPPVDNGFYYDFDLGEKISSDALPAIEKQMRKLLNKKDPFVREDMSIDEAYVRVKELDQPFKLELLNDLKERGINEVSFYRSGEFVDVCEGPHVEHAGEIPFKGFKLDSVAGAYWKGSEKNKMLTRIYGLAFKTNEELKNFSRLREEALKRDHRKLGSQLDIFHIDEEVGKGLPLWLPNGTVIRDELEKLAREYEFLDGYQRVVTPEITREELFYRSGHLPYYKSGMFPPMVLEEKNDSGEVTSRETFYLKPMNCPFHHMIYRARPRSYRELPLRFAEYGHNYRYEKSGQLSGLLRVRGMCMNDAHLYVPREQVKAEFIKVMELHLRYYKLLHFESWHMRLSLSDEDSAKYIPRPDLWKDAESACVEAMEELGLKYEAVRGEAAFYGPKIDVQVKNVIGREETASTNQVDPMAAQEDRFDLTYIGKDGNSHRPWVLHRAPLGTHERFIAFLTEHFAGAFPLWLAPMQVRILPIGDACFEYAEKLRQKLFSNFVRVEIDDSNESFNKKIRNGTTRKIPMLAILGEREVADNMVTIRRYHDQQNKETMSFDNFVLLVLREIRERVTPKPTL
ncbi:MAG: threonine--tRNA ligase [Deltaproteobacteria bacterium RIFOXYB12_FULL_58_9]|nr:MAG: threonine--tRNA ligase [Deltaproteobacteria bacterium RIFOXYB12_FULL_58_9]